MRLGDKSVAFTLHFLGVSVKNTKTRPKNSHFWRLFSS